MQQLGPDVKTKEHKLECCGAGSHRSPSDTIASARLFVRWAVCSNYLYTVRMSGPISASIPFVK